VADFDQSSALFKFGQRKLIPWPSGLDWIPDLVLALVVVAFLGHLVLKQMTFGQHVYAIGSNRTAAALSGVRVSRVQIGVLVVLGLTAGFSGVLGVAQSGSADPNAGAGFELDVIAAVIIGGAAISGGRGTILASLLGILLIGEVRNGLVIIGASIYGQIIVSGALVIIAVAIDRLITGRGERQSSIRKEVKLKTRQLGQRVGAVRRAGTR
jgi:ribose/xylose/arabinose/galactoside ABC-type transport system permease subunit